MSFQGSLGAAILTAAVGFRFDPDAPLWFVIAVMLGASLIGASLGNPKENT